MAKSSYITVKGQFPGLHAWSDCPIEAVDFLRYTHRHMFYVVITLPVSHDDRQLEFFVVQRHLERSFCNLGKFEADSNVFILGSKSCEMMGDIIIEYFRKIYPDLPWIRVHVSEDDENGAGVMWEAD